jgi:hypothetical protein
MDFTTISAIYRSPDGTGLALQNPDGEFVEIGREHGTWVTQGLLEVVPDHWVRLVPSEDPVREFWREARSTPVEASLEELAGHHHTEGEAP